MAKTFEQSLDEIARLVNEFRVNRPFYFAPDYKEAQARQDLIDPLFMALDWDVRNDNRVAPQKRQVLPEYALVIERHKKSADYLFRVDRAKNLFFVEAKKPGVPLKTDPASAYQVRRYGWTKKLSLSILTDFEEFAVYDCNFRPHEKDGASVARLDYYTYEQYPDHWRKIWDMFSREAVFNGALDPFIVAAKSKRGTQPVDAEFLKEIEGWRAALAKNIASLNPRLGLDDLNDAVQRTIDRIIFLRMAEDRGTEEYGRLETLLKRGNIYAGLLEFYHQADTKYNSGLFDLTSDRLTPGLQIDDEKLRAILRDLYYPKSPYVFSALAADTLGNVYEQFLGKVIRLTPSHQAKIEEKPEVKKAGGVYYTPTYIVDYIVKQTVGKWIDARRGEALTETSADRATSANVNASPLPKTFRVLDPACGSGSFLLGAYQLLLDHYLNWHIANRESLSATRTSPVPSRNSPSATSHQPIYESADGWRLTTAEKKRILLNHIFGVDIDRQAVEVTKLSLLLKVLEGESDETLDTQLKLFKERALPNLDQNIKCGNSLIGPDYFAGRMFPDAEELRRVNPFDWAREFPEAMKAGGFDCVIGNPPYVKEYVNRQPFHDLRGTKLQKYYQGKMDIWYIFACLTIDLLKQGGLHSFIATNNWITNSGASILRKKIFDETQISQFIDFGDFRVFKKAGIQTMIYVLEKDASPCKERIFYLRISNPKIRSLEVMKILDNEAPTENAIRFHASLSTNIEGSIFTFVNDEDNTVLDQIASKGTYRLSAHEVAQGIVTPQDSVIEKHLSILRRGDVQLGDGIFILSDEERRQLSPTPEENEIIKPYYTTNELGRYFGNSKNRLWIIYTPTSLLPHIKEYPHVKSHLDRFSKIMTSDNRPYGLHRAREERFFLGEKIISLRKTERPHFTYSDFPCYVSQTFFILQPTGIHLKYLVGILNSSVIYFWLRKKGKLQGELLQVDKEPLLQIPIRTVNFSDPTDKARHDRVVALVEQMLELHKLLRVANSQADRELIQRQIDATDKQIDALVYELYALTEQEIAIVESRININPPLP